MWFRGALLALFVVSCADSGTEGLNGFDASVADAQPSDAEAIEQLEGIVTVVESLGLVHLSARFQADPTDRFGCEQQIHGACRVLLCEASNEMKRFPHAGEIIAVAGTSTLSVSPSALNGVYATAELAVRWVPGEPVRIAGAGDEVPSFAAELNVPQTLRAGSWIVGPVSSGEPLEATWESTGPGRALVAFSQGISSTRFVYAECAFDAQAERGIVPPEVLRELPSGQVEARLMSAEMQEIEAGTWTLNLTTQTLAGLGAVAVTH
jgi:hypothetical protein